MGRSPWPRRLTTVQTGATRARRRLQPASRRLSRSSLWILCPMSGRRRRQPVQSCSAYGAATTQLYLRLVLLLQLRIQRWIDQAQPTPGRPVRRSRPPRQAGPAQVVCRVSAVSREQEQEERGMSPCHRVFRPRWPPWQVDRARAGRRRQEALRARPRQYLRIFSAPEHRLSRRWALDRLCRAVHRPDACRCQRAVLRVGEQVEVYRWLAWEDQRRHRVE